MQVDSNTLKAADACLLSVSVYKDGAEEAIIDTENPVTLECDGTYSVTLTLPKESASGYLVVTVDGREYYGNYLNQNNVL